MTAFTPLIDAATLSSKLGRDDLIVFDCRFDLINAGWGESEFAAAHIPGALYLHLERDLSSAITPASGRHPLPDPTVLARRLGALGVGPGSELVACDQGNGAYAARLWWLARWIGLEKVAVLDGGIAAWRAAGLPLTREVRARQPRELTARVNHAMHVDTATLDVLRRQPGNLLIDAQPAHRRARCGTLRRTQ
jgi:thiosulfate/3-mercaptopyruvate sulfurtransferase